MKIASPHYCQKLCLTLRSALRFAVLIVLFLALDHRSSSAATTDTWTGGGSPAGNWQNAANWGGTAPLANDFLLFDGSTQLLATNDFAAGTIFGNLNFSGAAGSFSLYGNSLILTNGLDAGGGTTLGGGITNSSTSNQTLNFPLTFSAGRHAISTDPGAGQLNLSGPITRNTGAGLVFVQLGSPINLTGSGLANVNGILGGFAYINNGVVFSDWASLDINNNVVPYAAYTDLSSGAVANNASSNVRLTGDTAAFTAANGTTVNSILSQITGAARNLTVTGVLRLGAKGGIFANSTASQTLTVTGGSITTAGTGGELSLLSVPGATTARLTINSAITNDTGNAAVSVNVQGYMSLGGANTFSGGTFIYNNGRVTAGNALSFGTGLTTVYPGGEAFLNTAGPFTNRFDIAGVGTTEVNVGITGPGAIRSASSSVISGRVTFHGNTRISTSSTTSPQINGQITGDGQLELITFGTANSNFVLSNSNNPANDWPGGTVINSLAATRQVFIKIGANQQIPDGVGKGNLTINGTDIARFDLNGFNETINGLVSGTGPSANIQVANFGTAPSTLTLGNNNVTATFNGVIIDGTPLSLVKIGIGTQTLGGVNSYKGTTSVNGGALLLSSGASIAGTSQLNINSNGTLDVSAVVPVNFATNPITASNGTFVVSLVAGGNAITTPSLASLGGTNFITVTAIPAISTYPAQFVAIKATNTVTGTLNFGLAGALPPSPGTPFAGYVSNNVANNSVDVVITTGPTSIKWAGYDGSSVSSSWDTFTTDWKTFAGALTTYSDGSFVTFDDSASNATVSVNQTVSPAGITVNNNTLAYTINGGAGISGGGSLTKQGSGTLILDNGGNNDFSGVVNINSGTLQIGNGDSAGSIPTAANVINNGSLVLARSDFVTIANIISGSGSINENGSSSASVTLSGANTFTGPLTVSQGTLQLGNNLALGATNSGTTVASGATLDITANTINVGQEQITISGAGVTGNGALINSSGSATFTTPNLARLVLAGDAVVGGAGRMDLRAATTGNPALASLSSLGQPRKLTKTGTGQFSIVGVTVDPLLGDIEVQQGLLSLELATTGLGNPNNSLTVFSGASLQFFAPTNLLNKHFVLNDGSTLINGSGASTVIGPMNVTNFSGSATPFVVFNVGGTSLALSNTIVGNGIISKSGASPMTLSGNSSGFAGGIQVNAGSVSIAPTAVLSNAFGINVLGGSLTVDGSSLGQGFTNSSISTVNGSGSSAGLNDVSGNLFPGASNVVGTLTVGSLILEASANVGYDLGYSTNAGGTFNDLVNVNGDLTMNGGSIVINPLSLLRKGPVFSYRLINYSGALVTNGIPSVNVPQNYTAVLDFSTTNQVNVVFSGGPPAWDGGSASTSNWSDSANWGGVAISSGNSLFFAGPNRLNNNNDTAPGSMYQDLSFNSDAPAFTLNGNDINLAGNIINTSTNAQTVLIPMSSSAANNTFNGGTNGPGSKLIIGGGWTNTASTATSNTLVGVGIWTNLLFTANSGITNTISITDTNSNWTLVDNASSAGMTNPVILDVLAGNFTFGQGSSAPTLACTSTGVSRVGVGTTGPAVLNMNNGTLTFAGRLNTGTALGSVATINQSGGTLDAQALLQLSDGASNAFTTVNLSGGTLNVGTPTAQSLFLCSRGTGIFNVTISGVVRCGTFDLSRDIGPTYGKVNLDGGRIEANRLGTGTSASTGAAGAVAIVNFNGGTLRARQDNATFIQGATGVPITCLVRSNGAIIDSSTFNISVLEPLQHDTNSAAPATDGGLLKLGSGNLTLTAANTYTGPTVISNGTLSVTGSLGTNTVTVTTNGTLAGTGVINGPVTVNGGGAISPAGAGVTGTLTVSNNVTFQPNGRAVMEINKSPVANDLLIAKNTNATTITFNGTLAVTNLAGTLAAGDSFKLFSATNYSGTFTSIQPPQPAIGLVWNTSQLYTAGILQIGAVPVPGITNIALSGGNNIVIGGTNGTAGLSYRVLTSPDVMLPTSSWTILGTNTFDGSGNFQFSIGTTNAQQFFRLQAL